MAGTDTESCEHQSQILNGKLPPRHKSREITRKRRNKKMQPNGEQGANDRTLATALPSELLLESLTPLNESRLCGHGFFLRGLPLRFGAENK